MCRREGVSLCGRVSCALKRRPYPPGVHGPQQGSRIKLSGYGIQLREKQKAKRLYQIMERQFRRYVEMAARSREDTGTAVVQQLERRLDNVVYRLGMGGTRRQARQMVSHGFIAVNGRKVNIPSYSVSVGDTVSLRSEKEGKTIMKEALERLKQGNPPGWLSRVPEGRAGQVVSLPVGDDLKTVFDPKIIVEFYSR
jgi:small subunit ribosomal protein S4